MYTRSELHLSWGGAIAVQQQGGILTPRGAPVVIVITGASGAAYGYHDTWKDGVLHYFGAGQEGPMEFKRGNKALRDHVADGEAVHLFRQEVDGLRYLHEVSVGGWYYLDAVPDVRGELRQAIVFKLVPLDQLAPDVLELDEVSDEQDWAASLSVLRSRALQAANTDADSPQHGSRRIYQRSRSLRTYILRRADGHCEGCGRPAPFLTRQGRPYLEPHHTLRLSDGGPDVVWNVIALCPTCHRRVHHGQDGKDFNDSLRCKLRALEPPHSAPS
jgi:5-methylcytosine-specific restriction protein A